MTELARVGIVGLGVIGGSIARDLTGRGITVVGYDQDGATLALARDEGAVSRTVDDSLTGLESCDVVIVAVSAGNAREALRRVARLKSTMTITDVGSTKADVVKEARRLKIGRRFVGGHPLAGDHRTGFAHARPGMFAGTTTYLCPASESEPSAIARVEDLWSQLGARTLTLDAKAHDHLLAYSSHLPHIAASALALSLLRAGIRASDLGPGGRDATRIAGASPEMWAAIALVNAAELIPALDGFRLQLQRLTRAIRSGDDAGVRAMLSDARAWRLDADL